MASHSSRDTNVAERSAPIKTADKGKGIIHEGPGTPLSNIAVVPLNLNKIDADHDLLKALHAYLYGIVGKKTVRKKNIRSFSGFAEGNDEAHEARVKKLKDSRKWTVAALKDLCTLLGLDKGGSKAEVADRIASFLASPDPAASKAPVAKKPKVDKKRKPEEKGGKAKKVKRVVKPRAKSGYMMFCQAMRPKLIKDEGPMPPTEVTKKLALMWGECSDAQKEKFKKKGLKEFEKTGGNSSVAKAKIPVQVEEVQEEDDDGQGEEGEAEEEEEEPLDEDEEDAEQEDDEDEDQDVEDEDEDED